MALCSFSIKTPWPAEKVFEFMANLRNLTAWDPGVHNVEQVVGEQPGLNAEFNVTVDGFSGPMTLIYVMTGFETPHSFSVRAKSELLNSYDQTTVVATGEGCTVTYSAELTLNDSLGIADEVFAKTFNIVGERAACGLAEALQGTRVE